MQNRRKHSRPKHFGLRAFLLCVLTMVLIWDSTSFGFCVYAEESKTQYNTDESGLSTDTDPESEITQADILIEQTDEKPAQSETPSLDDATSKIEETTETDPVTENETIIETTNEPPTPQQEENKEPITPETKTLQAYGDDFNINISYDDTAKLPDNVNLEVAEYTEESDEYEATMNELIPLMDNTKTYSIRILDISLTEQNKIIEPANTVTVSAQIDTMNMNNDISIVHFGETKTEVLDTTIYNDTMEFETNSFSKYVFMEETGTKGDPIIDLDGKVTPLIVHTKSIYCAVQAEPKTFASPAINGLAPLEVAGVVLNGETRITSNGEETYWNFTAVDPTNKPGVYYIWADVNGTQKYMTITPQRGGDLTLSDTAGSQQEITVLYDDNGRIRLDYGGYAPNLKGDNLNNGFQSSNYFGDSEEILLTNPISNVNYAYIRNISDITAEHRVYGQSGSRGTSDQVIIYGIYYDSSGVAHYVSIANDGTIMPVTRNGNRIYWSEDVDPNSGSEIEWISPNIWRLVEYVDEIDDNNGVRTGYYELYAENSGMYLAPSDTDILHENPVGIALDGRTVGDANSYIEAWNDTYHAYMGINIDLSNMETISEIGDGILWRFATIEEAHNSSDPTTSWLNLVETISSSHISLTMYDFDEDFQNSVIGTTNYTPTAAQTGLMSNTLDENGWPVSTLTSTSLSELYTSEAYVSDASNLFLKDIYESTGYYTYDSRENYAWLNTQANEFEIYQQIGTAPGSNLDYGNFLPFNSIRRISKVGHNTAVGEDDPRYGEPLYISADPINYNFGMRMDVDFYIPQNGLINGDPLHYEFSGDDDLWIYVDGVLILDLGGIHSRLQGSIDFTTGEVHGTPDENLTIFEMFQRANVLPDGSPWDNNRVSEFFSMTYNPLTDEFTGTPTFKTYTGHTLTMFYMERGKHASNLKMTFNMPESKPNSVVVEKSLADTAQEQYGTNYYAFQVLVDDNTTDNVLNSAVYEDTEEPIEFHDVTIRGVQYENVFFLKAGEAAVFTIDELSHYHVRELGISASDYDIVTINDAALVNGHTTPPDDGIIESTSALAKYRPRTTIQNHCSDSLSRNLEITKSITPNTIYDPTDKFEFYVFIEDNSGEVIIDDITGEVSHTQGKLVPYARNDYYLRAPDGTYCQGIQHGMPVSVSQTPVVFAQSGPYGTIGSVPAGYTIVIPDLMAGTDFYVAERTSRSPDYNLMSCDTIHNNTYDNDPGQISNNTVSIDNINTSVNALGAITHGYDAQVAFVNEPKSTITVHKTWVDNYPIASHTAINVALFTDNGTTLVENTVKTLDTNNWTATWTVTNPDNYVVREVTPVDDTYQPINPSQNTTCTVNVDNHIEQVSYKVTYTQGTTENNNRNDEITNTQNTNEPTIVMPNTGMNANYATKTITTFVALLAIIIGCAKITKQHTTQN